MHMDLLFESKLMLGCQLSGLTVCRKQEVLPLPVLQASSKCLKFQLDIPLCDEMCVFINVLKFGSQTGMRNFSVMLLLATL